MTAEKDQQNVSSTSSAPPSNNRIEILLAADVVTDSKRIHDPENDTATSNDSKRLKEQEWLKYQGKRHTRIGDDYQANLLPKPNEEIVEIMQNHFL